MNVRTGIVGLSITLLLLTAASAQELEFSFTSAGSGTPEDDPFIWPGDILPEEPDNSFAAGYNELDPDFQTQYFVTFTNNTGNLAFFDDNYQAAGNSTVISNEALWGNPSVDTRFDPPPSLTIEPVAIQSPIGGGFGQILHPDLILFDVTLARSSSPPAEITGTFEDTEGAVTGFSVPLDEIFPAGPAFGGFDGGAATVELTPGPGADGIVRLEIDFGSVNNFDGQVGEFAIDNFYARFVADEPPPPTDSNVYPLPEGLGGIGANSLTNQFNDFTLWADVFNDGPEATTYSVQIDGDFFDPVTEGQIGVPIDPDQTIGQGMTAAVSLATSGDKTGTMTLVNDLNGDDPDEVVGLRLVIFEPASLTDNTGQSIDPVAGDSMTVDNAPAPAGGLRASAQVVSRSVAVSSGRPFAVDGLEMGDAVHPGGSTAARVKTAGLLSGSYAGTFSAGFGMRTNDTLNPINLAPADPFATPSWDISFTLADRTEASAEVLVGADLDEEGVEINTERTAVALIDGSSASDQTISLGFVAGTTLAGAPLVGEAAELTFSAALPGGGTQEPYVLAITYRDEDVPSAIEETALRILYLQSPGQWTEAILANSDAGAGGAFFVGSFEEFEDAAGGFEESGLPLSAFGLDPVGNQAWAILDHAGIFAIGVPDATMGDANLDGVVDDNDLSPLLAHWGQDVTGQPGRGWGQGEFDGLAPVQDNDLSLLLANWTGAGAVPEPASAMVVLLGFASAALRRGRKQA